jgi:hypothetical protein
MPAENIKILIPQHFFLYVLERISGLDISLKKRKRRYCVNVHSNSM